MAKKSVRHTRSGAPRDQTSGFMTLSRSIAELLRNADYTTSRCRVDLHVLNKDVKNYQREANDKEINQLFAVWNNDLCEDLFISVRDDDSMWIIDGGHRVIVALKKGITCLWARLFKGLTLAEEAAIFHLLDTSHMALNHHDIHAAVKTTEDPRILAVERVVKNYGCNIPRHPRVDGKTINCIKQIDTLCVNPKYKGIEILNDIMEIITSSWDEAQENRFHSCVFKGLIHLFTSNLYAPLINKEQFISGLRRTNADEFLKKSYAMKAAMSSLSKSSAYVFIQFYNHGRKKHFLDISPLVDKKRR